MKCILIIPYLYYCCSILFSSNNINSMLTITTVLLHYILQSEAVVPQRGGGDGAEPVPHTGLPGAAAAPHYDRPQVYHVLNCMVVYVVGALDYMCITAVCSVCRVQYSHTSPSCSL